MTSAPQRRNPFFPVVTLFGVLFIVTIFAFIAALLGDPAAPMAKLLDRYGGMFVAVEVAGIILSGLCAMALDRAQAVRNSPVDHAPSSQTEGQQSAADNRGPHQ